MIRLRIRGRGENGTNGPHAGTKGEPGGTGPSVRFGQEGEVKGPEAATHEGVEPIVDGGDFLERPVRDGGLGWNGTAAQGWTLEGYRSASQRTSRGATLSFGELPNFD